MVMSTNENDMKYQFGQIKIVMNGNLYRYKFKYTENSSWKWKSYMNDNDT